MRDDIMVQLTILTNDNYGSWTHTLGNDREHKVQMYQCSLYETLQNLFSVRGGLVFSNRFDEFFAISDGISYTDHLDIKTKLQTLFPFEISLAISNSHLPLQANKQAHAAKMAVNCTNTISAAVDDNTKNDGIHLIHLDIEGITEMKKTTSPYDITMLVQATHQIISHYCYENMLMGFFVGGDNFVILSDKNPQIHSKLLAAKILKHLNIIVNCGIGEEKTARIAMAMATKNLDMIRHVRKHNESFPRILDNTTSLEGLSGIHA
jgi:GTP cyclohydrolase IIa